MVRVSVKFNFRLIVLQSIEDMKDMRGDMCGAAAVVATCRAIASLRLPVNLRGLIPLCEHMTGCNAIKAGDVVKAMNGKTIEIEVTSPLKHMPNNYLNNMNSYRILILKDQLF